MNNQETLRCPKCGNEKRSLLQDRKMIWCGKCGWMEEDEEAFAYKVAMCPRCNRVPQAVAHHDMTDDENTLDWSAMLWRCCGATFPVWPDQVEFWCHIYLAQSRRNEGKYD